MIVIYRGQFCPFCKGTLDGVQAKLTALADAGIDIIAISADPVDVAQKMATERVGEKQ